MKRNIITSLLLAMAATSALMMSGCEKPENDEPKDYATLVQGKWNVKLDESFECYNEPDWEEKTTMADWAESIQIEFCSDSILKYTSVVGEYEDSWNDRYHVHGDTLTWDTKDYKIYQLDENGMVMESKVIGERTRANGSTYETVLTKHYEMTR